jgi:hypothetical protein
MKLKIFAAALLWPGAAFAADPIACDLCGQRLLHDIPRAAATLKNAVAQARAKYDHCINGAGAACPDSCWQTRLADPLGECASHEGAAYQVCVTKVRQSAGETCEGGG